MSLLLRASIADEWALPVSLWGQSDYSAAFVVSEDDGQNWRQRGACHVPDEHRSFDEHMVVEKNDGTLWMWVRTKYGIGESISRDQGYTWSELLMWPKIRTGRFMLCTILIGSAPKKLQWLD